MMTKNEISAHGPRIFNGTFIVDAGIDLNIIFLLEVNLSWEQLVDGCPEFQWLHQHLETRTDFERRLPSFKFF